MDCIHVPHWSSSTGCFGPGSRLPGGSTIGETELKILENSVPGGISGPARLDAGFMQGLSDPFLLVHGTGIRFFDASLLHFEMENRHADLLVVARAGPGTDRPLLTGPDGRIESFGCDRQSNLRDSGVWLVGRRAASAAGPALSCPGAFLSAAMQSGASLYSECLASYCRVVESAADYLLLCGDVLGGRMPPAGGVEARRLILDPSAAIAEGAVFEGLVWVDGGASIGRGCRIENSVILGEASVGEGSVLRNALVMPRSVVPAFSDLSDKYLCFIGG